MTRRLSTDVVVFNDTRVDEHHGCSRVMRTLEMLLERVGCRVIARSPAHSDWQSDPDVCRAVESARLLVVNAEGTLHHDSVAGMRLLDVGELGAAKGIPAVLLNCGWHDNAPGLARRLRSFALVCARDRSSAIEMGKGGVSCPVIPDLSLYLPRVGAARERQDLAYTDSVLPDETQLLEDSRRALDGETLPIHYRGSGVGGLLRFYRRYVGRRDLWRPRALARSLRLRTLQLAAQVADDEAFVERLGGYSLLVTGRYHAATMALIARTPFIALPSNTRKIESLVEDAGIASWRVVRSLSRDTIDAATRTGWESGELRAIDDYLDDGRRRTDALFNEMAALA